MLSKSVEFNFESQSDHFEQISISRIFIEAEARRSYFIQFHNSL